MRQAGSSAAARKASSCLKADMDAWTEGRGLAMHISTRQPAVLSVDVGSVRVSDSLPAVVELARPGVQTVSLVLNRAVPSTSLSVLGDQAFNLTRRLLS